MKNVSILTTATSVDVRTQKSAKSVIIMIKECQICGKEFNARNNRYVNCSPECAKISHTRHVHSDYYRQRERMRYRLNHASLCKICGNQVERTRDPDARAMATVFHDRCVVIDMINTMNSGQMYSKAQKCRVCSRGYLISDIRQWAKMYAEDGNTKRFEELM